MTYKEFMISLIEKKTKGVYLFDSKEDYLLETIIETSKDLIAIADFNYIDIKEKTDYEKIKTSFETYPVMEDKKIIIWRNIDLSKNNIKEYNYILEDLINDLENFPEYASLFIFSEKSPFKGKFYKKVQKYGKIVEIDRLNSNELLSFIGKRFKKNNKKIQKSLINDIINRFSYLNKNSEIDLFDVVNTVDKIISSSREELVSKDDVANQLDQVLNLNIFNLTDAISEKNSQKAINIFLHMEKAGEDVFMIYHMIIRQIRNLIGIKTLIENGYNENFVMKSLGIGNFELKKLRGFIHNFKREELFEIHDMLYKIDKNQKSQDFDMNLNMIMLIEKICI